MSALELWGGVECTKNRVGDAYFDQLHWSRHAYEIGDLERFAALGIRTLRFPARWEDVESVQGQYDWRWLDERVAAVRRLGIRPIAGLLHHGSGPRWTDLLDPRFPEHFVRYAAAFARRYPDIEAYTPINEPLTTARFSALYGIWYPHARDDRSFLVALLNQYRATLLAMQAIREVVPAAHLLMTEDIGKTHAAPGLQYQADFENARRFMTYQFLRGEPPAQGLLAGWLRANGVGDDELAWFDEHGDRAAIAGINYYITSERYLDGALANYPARTHGGNAFERYADTEATEVTVERAGWSGILREVHDQVGGSLALTEVHRAGSSDEQIRWLAEAHCAAHALRAAGADVRAVTVWSLLGAYNWSHLVTHDSGIYEAGVFDVREGPRRATPLADFVRTLAKNGLA